MGGRNTFSISIINMNVYPVVDKDIFLPARLYAFHASTCFRAPTPLNQVGGWLDIHFNHGKPNTGAPTTLEMPSNHEPGRTPTTSRRRRRKPMKQYLHNVLTPWNTKHSKVCHMDKRTNRLTDRHWDSIVFPSLLSRLMLERSWWWRWFCSENGDNIKIVAWKRYAF